MKEIKIDKRIVEERIKLIELHLKRLGDFEIFLKHIKKLLVKK